jgi:Leucine Rich Repeat (LRR) protein
VAEATAHPGREGMISTKVVALTEGALKAMLLTKLKTSLVFLIVIGLARAGIGSMSYLNPESPQKDVPKKEADSSVKQERTIAAIKELGGHVLIDRGTDNTSTIKVILSETDVQDKDFEQLKGLPTLQELYLFRTKVAGERLKYLKGFTRLQKLDLSHCTELTEAGLTNLKGLTKLQSLDVTATGIRDADLESIKNLTGLQTLYLRFNPITDAGLVELKGLTKLQTLVLDRTEITDAGLNYLQGLTKLRTLRLANAQLTDATLVQLKGFADLRSLSPGQSHQKHGVFGVLF